MFLTSPDEVVSYLGQTIEGVLRSPQHAGRAERLRLGLIDPDCVLVVDCGRAEVHVGRREERDLADFAAMTTDIAVGLCQGTVDVVAAVESGAVAVNGEGALLLELIASAGSPAGHQPIVDRQASQDAPALRQLVAAG